MRGAVVLPRSFAHVRPLASAVIVLLAVDIVLAWLSLLGAIVLVERVWHGLSGHLVGEGTLGEHVRQLELLRRLHGLAWFATAAVFLRWVHDAYWNLAHLGAAGLGYTPRWAVGAFFVPILNLIHPLHVVGELWRGSDPSGPGDALRRGSISPWVVAWWLVFVTSVVADPALGRLLDSMEGRLELGRWAFALFVAAPLEIAAAALAITVVARVTGYQERRLGRPSGRPGR